MTKLAQGQTLARQADRAALLRGHRLGAWLWRTQGIGRTGEAVCRECGRSAFVRTDPAQNEINISGEAVAVNCKDCDCIDCAINGEATH